MNAFIDAPRVSLVIVSTLGHCLWQGLVIGAIAWSARRAVHDPQRGYAIVLAALVMMIASPLATGITLWSRSATASLASNVRDEAPPARTESPNRATTPRPMHESTRRSRTEQRTTWEGTALTQSKSPAPQPHDDARATRDRIVVSVWLLGVLLLSIRMLAGLRGLRAMRSRSSTIVDVTVEAIFVRCSSAVAIPRWRRVTLSTSPDIASPLTFGYWRPVVLLPLRALSQLTPQQLECLLLHELDHVRRGDYAINLLARATEALLFFHPVVWWLGRALEHDRELCCDDAVLSAGGDRRAYLESLVLMETLRRPDPQLGLALRDGPLLERIRRLTNRRPHTCPVTPTWLAGLLTLTVTFTILFALTGPSLAARQPEAGQTASPTSTDDATKLDAAIDALRHRSELDRPSAPIRVVDSGSSPASLAPTTSPLDDAPVSSSLSGAISNPKITGAATTDAPAASPATSRGPITGRVLAIRNSGKQFVVVLDGGMLEPRVGTTAMVYRGATYLGRLRTGANYDALVVCKLELLADGKLIASGDRVQFDPAGGDHGDAGAARTNPGSCGLEEAKSEPHGTAVRSSTKPAQLVSIDAANCTAVLRAASPRASFYAGDRLELYRGDVLTGLVRIESSFEGHAIATILLTSPRHGLKVGDLARPSPHAVPQRGSRSRQAGFAR